MCNLDDGFKLCSCNEDKLQFQEIDWSLERINSSIPAQHRRGRAVIPQYSNEQQVCIETIMSHLNSRACFDFDYSPVKQDRLSIKVNDKWYHLCFSGRKWTKDSSSSLSAWRTQLEKYKEGKLK